MILKEIVLQGFKSFADRVKLDLGPGVTTIVGPNGCGKSNVVDAIRWVLGEQSAKALRGGKMHDVIFAGTDNRNPMDTCEVSLLFTDCEERLGTAYNEVQITRRVNRDGGSYYYLNGKVVRLKDIQNLFMDTGLGRSSYSFMMQGQIDQILSSNPEERRMIFEEAAGVTRYKNQRREALGKLEQVERNLARVRDVVEEVLRQKGTLKRQASKALRYRRLKHRMDHLDLAHAVYRYYEKLALIQGLQKEVDQLRALVQDSTAALKEDEEALKGKKEERESFYQALQVVQQKVFDFRSQKDQFENQSEVALVRKKDTQARLEEFEREITSLEKNLKELETKTEDDAQSKQLQLDLVDSSNLVYQKKSQEVDAVEEKLRSTETQVQQNRNEVIKAEGELSRLKSKMSQLEVIINTNDAKAQDLKDKEKELELEQVDVGEKLKQIEIQIGELDELFGEKSAKIAETEQGVKEAVEILRTGQAKIQEQDRVVAKVQAQVGILENMQAKLEGFSEGAKAILKGKLSSVIEEGDFHVLAQGVDVASGYEKMFEVLVGQAMEGIALDEVGKVSGVFEAILANNYGRVCLQVDLGDGGLFLNDNVPELLQPAITQVDIQNKALKKHWERLLEGCYFTESLEPFLEYWEATPGFRFAYVVTRAGQLVDGRGLIYGGASGKKSGGANYIQREKELRQLKQQLENEKEALEVISKESVVIQAKVRDLEELRAAQKKDLEQDRSKLSELKAEERSLKNVIARNDQAIVRVKEQQESLQKTHHSSKLERESVEKLVSASEEKLQGLREHLVQFEQAITGVRTERDTHREALAELRIELAEKKQKLTMIDKELTELERRKEGIARRKEHRIKDLQQAKDKVIVFAQEIETFKLKAQECAKSMDQELEQLEVARKRLTDVEAFIKEIDLRLEGQRKQVHQQEVVVKDKELVLAKETSQFNFIVEKIRVEHEVEVEDVDWKEWLWKADEEFETRLNMEDLEDAESVMPVVKRERGEPTEDDLRAMEQTDWNAIEREVKELRGKITSMGAVNLVAIEEYAELKERYEFLKNQCDDLESSKNQLIGAIEEINKTSQAMFLETFKKVRENFQETFQKLFGGGFSDLELMDSAEDVLESGIEIIARPPGTKLKNLTLLSGGQKTMTAVALLFAIYQVKPSPFCVLDELDAPLDDANIGRFTAMLKEFTQYSQFLVISHNKRTISESNTLYGVTMEERGVTKLISMRFNNREQTGDETLEAA